MSPRPPAATTALIRAERDLKAACWAVAAWRIRSRSTPRRFVLKRNETLPPLRIFARWRDTTLPLRKTSSTAVWPATNGFTRPLTRTAPPRAT